jgi:signal peptidase II
MQAARGTPLTGPAAAGQEEEPESPAQVEAAQVEPAQVEPAQVEAGRSRPRIVTLVAVAVLVLALDIVSKVVVVATLSDRAPIRLLGGFLHLRVDRNPGAAFSFAPGLTILFSLIAIAVIVVILRSSRRIRSIPWAVTLGLLLGGATGNLVDRIFRHPGVFRGWVVDWIQIPHWPVFNLADSAIVCGGVLAVLLSIRGIRLDGQRESR